MTPVSKADPRNGGLRPRWLRPLALTTLVGLHGAVLAGFVTTEPPSGPADAVDVTLVSVGDSAEDQKPQAEVQPADPPPAPRPRHAPYLPSLSLPRPSLRRPSLPRRRRKWRLRRPCRRAAAAKLAAEPRPVEKRVLAAPAPARQAERRPKPPSDPRGKPQEALPAAHKGVETGAEDGGMSRADYGALVVAELNRRKFFPAAARQAGASGSVGVSFTLGPSGRVISQSIVRSSGNAALDDAARAILCRAANPAAAGRAFQRQHEHPFSYRIKPCAIWLNCLRSRSLSQRSGIASSRADMQQWRRSPT